MEAIQSIHTLLLGKIALPPQLTPSILPTPPPPTSMIDKDKLVIIWNPQLVQPSLPTHNHNANNIVQHPCNCQGHLQQRPTYPQSQHLPPLATFHLPITNLSSHTQLIEATHCPYDQFHHRRRPHAHTFTLHSSTFTSLQICVRS